MERHVRVFLDVLSILYMATVVTQYASLEVAPVDHVHDVAPAQVHLNPASHSIQFAKLTPPLMFVPDDYKCISWRATNECTPEGSIWTTALHNCTKPIPASSSGYCEFRDIESHEIRKVLKIHCGSIPFGVSITCLDAFKMINYGQMAPYYIHDRAFSDTRNQEMLRTDLTRLTVTTSLTAPTSLTNGVIYVAANAQELASVYVSVRRLRATGCLLPIELWWRESDLEVTAMIQQELLEQFNIYPRVMNKAAGLSRVGLVPYAVFYSAFESVLLLDVSNLAVLDPTYLFTTTGFLETGALLWSDYRRPRNRKGWPINATSVLWETLGIDAMDTFELDLGQVVIDRKRHRRTLNLLMYLVAQRPNVLDEFQLVSGLPSLFRLAWAMACAPSFRVGRAPGAAGVLNNASQHFCGVTLVQHDPVGAVLFLNRRALPLETALRQQPVWTHLQWFTPGTTVEEFNVTVSSPEFAPLSQCFGIDDPTVSVVLTPISELPFAGLEHELTVYGLDAMRLSGAHMDSTRPRLRAGNEP